MLYYIYAQHFETQKTYTINIVQNREQAVEIIAEAYRNDSDYGILGDYYYFMSERKR